MSVDVAAIAAFVATRFLFLFFSEYVGIEIQIFLMGSWIRFL